jgi:molybdopterin-guanine dinucleotide biosynthesis protein A
MVKMKYVEDDEINRFDREHLSFFNINSQADLDRARRLAAEGG